MPLFDQKQFYVLKLDKLNEDPLGEIKKIYGFLGVDTEFSPVIARHNEGNETARFPWFQYLIDSKMKKLGVLQEESLRTLTQWNMMPVPEQNAETRFRLIQRYSADQKLLKKLTGIDFE